LVNEIYDVVVCAGNRLELRQRNFCLIGNFWSKNFVVYITSCDREKNRLVSCVLRPGEDWAGLLL
jgi:hypothetical protein